MKHEEMQYISHRLARAGETLDEARLLFNGGFTSGVVNRMYYACFYAVSALLFSEGYSSSKHSGVISLFDRLWIKPKRLSSDMGVFYHKMFEYRQKGDYEDLFSFQPEDVEAWLSKATEFVDTVCKHLEESK